MCRLSSEIAAHLIRDSKETAGRGGLFVSSVALLFEKLAKKAAQPAEAVAAAGALAAAAAGAATGAVAMRAAVNDGKLFVVEKFVVQDRLLFYSEGRIHFVRDQEAKTRSALMQ